MTYKFLLFRKASREHPAFTYLNQDDSIRVTVGKIVLDMETTNSEYYALCESE
ncbi:hypothetical protein [Spirosoma daeguense]